GTEATGVEQTVAAAGRPVETVHFAEPGTAAPQLNFGVRPQLDMRCSYGSKNRPRLPCCHRRTSASHRECRSSAEARRESEAQERQRDLRQHEGPTLRSR